MSYYFMLINLVEIRTAMVDKQLSEAAMLASYFTTKYKSFINFNFVFKLAKSNMQDRDCHRI